LLTSVRRAILRLAFLADFVLAISGPLWWSARPAACGSPRSAKNNGGEPALAA
jgi:hypothetical protein